MLTTACTGDGDALESSVENRSGLSTNSGSGLDPETIEEILNQNSNFKYNFKIVEIDQNTEAGDAILTVGDTLELRGALFDLNGVFVEDAPVEWSPTNNIFPSSSLTKDAAASYKVAFVPLVTGTTSIRGDYAGDKAEVASRSDITGEITVQSDKVPTSLAIHAGNNQSAIVNQTLQNSLDVIVKDEFENPIPGSNVTFAVISGGGSIVSESNVLSDVNGVASATVRVGTATGAQIIRAVSEIDGSLSADFSATSLVGAATHLTWSGTPGTSYASFVLSDLPLNVTIHDAFQNLDSSASGTVDLSVDSGTLSGDTSVALSGGSASFNNITFDTQNLDLKITATWSGDNSVTGDTASFIVYASPAGGCLTSDANFTTADGGCKDLSSGLIWSSLSSSTHSWYDAIFDSTYAGNSADADDYGRTNDYDVDNDGCTGNCDNSTTNYCHSLTDVQEGGKSDWRMPTLSELESLYTNSSSSPGTYIDSLASESHFSSTTNSSDTSEAKVYNLVTGVSGDLAKSSSARLICVRGKRKAIAGFDESLLLRAVVQGHNTGIIFQLLDEDDNKVAREDLPISMSTDLGSFIGLTPSGTTDSTGRLKWTLWYADTAGDATFTVDTGGVADTTVSVKVSASAWDRVCSTNNAEFGTADGGCKDLENGIVWSSKSASTMTWYETIWDATQPVSNSVPESSDTASNDYDSGDPGAYPDLSTTNYCHDDVNEGGFTDWRVPTLGEAGLSSSAGIYSTVSGLSTTYYWTSTPLSSTHAYAKSYRFAFGGGSSHTWRTDSTSVLCVRKNR